MNDKIINLFVTPRSELASSSKTSRLKMLTLDSVGDLEGEMKHYCVIDKASKKSQVRLDFLSALVIEIEKTERNVCRHQFIVPKCKRQCTCTLK